MRYGIINQGKRTSVEHFLRTRRRSDLPYCTVGALKCRKKVPKWWCAGFFFHPLPHPGPDYSFARMPKKTKAENIVAED